MTTTDYGLRTGPKFGLGRDMSDVTSHRRKLTTVRSWLVCRSEITIAMTSSQVEIVCKAAATRNNGTFRWDEKKDKILLREVRQKEPYVERIGSKEAGQKWSEIAAAVNTHVDFAVMPRDQRSVRERFNKLLSDFNAKMQKEEKASGISPDDLSEVDQILEEIQEVIASNAIAPCATSDKGKSESERAKALTIRNRAMTSWGKEAAEDGNEEEATKPKRQKRSRRSGTDPLEYLKTKREAEMEMKKEEMAFRREQLSMEGKRIEAEQKRQAQMQEQFLIQQRQLQQQMQAQAQSQALLMTLLAKMNKS